MIAASLRLRVTAMSHRGAVRESNEDSLAVGPFTACAAQMDDPATWLLPLAHPVLVAVADGLGGHAAGEVASAHAVRALAIGPTAGTSEMESALRTIDSELLVMSAREPELAGLGTTVAGVVVGGGVGLRFSVGDSRIYLERGGYLAQLSRDDRSELTGGLVQCLGGRTDGTPLLPQVEPLDDDLADARILICSDGLSDLVDVSRLEEHLAEPGGPARSVKAMWASAMNASGRDNITIALLEILPGDDPDTAVGNGREGQPDG